MDTSLELTVRTIYKDQAGRNLEIFEFEMNCSKGFIKRRIREEKDEKIQERERKNGKKRKNRKRGRIEKEEEDKIGEVNFWRIKKYEFDWWGVINRTSKCYLHEIEDWKRDRSIEGKNFHSCRPILSWNTHCLTGILLCREVRRGTKDGKQKSEKRWDKRKE